MNADDAEFILSRVQLAFPGISFNGPEWISALLPHELGHATRALEVLPKDYAPTPSRFAAVLRGLANPGAESFCGCENGWIEVPEHREGFGIVTCYKPCPTHGANYRSGGGSPRTGSHTPTPAPKKSGRKQ